MKSMETTETQSGQPESTVGEMTTEATDIETTQTGDTGPANDGEERLMQDELDALIAEAEHRGYLRGRNEKIKLAMEAPALWRSTSDNDPDIPDEPQPVILANMRPSIWD